MLCFIYLIYLSLYLPISIYFMQTAVDFELALWFDTLNKQPVVVAKHGVVTSLRVVSKSMCH